MLETNFENTKKKLLIVDDSDLSHRFLNNICSVFGFDIVNLKRGRDALELLRTKKFDCMLLDLLMPDMTGFEVLEYLQQNSMQIPVIVISADIQTTTYNKVISLGAKSMLKKPPKENQLREIFTELAII